MKRPAAHPSTSTRFQASSPIQVRDKGPFLVLGATGKTGRRLIDRLNRHGYGVRPGSRRATPRFDWTDPATWTAALSGADAVYVAFQPDLAAPGGVSAVTGLAECAARNGVTRLVLLAGRGEPAAEAAEDAMKEVADGAGMEWTVIRASWFTQNFTESFVEPMIRSGFIALPAGDTAEPFVDVEDIADVAFAALTEGGHTGETYDVTGPELLTFADVAEMLSSALARSVRYLPLSHAEFVAGLNEAGMSEAESTMIGDLFAEVLDGRNAFLGDGVLRALGRAPRTFGDFVRQAVEAGAWLPTPSDS
jgi:uncharacterized protein YbjT (DUF2867 family)